MVHPKLPPCSDHLVPPDNAVESPPSPPPYEMATQIQVQELPQKKCCRRRGSRFCLACCSFYGLFCFFWSIMILACLCITIGSFVSVVDSCINPTVTLTSTNQILFQEKHPNLANLSVYISVVSGSIQIKRSTDPNTMNVEVIRGASSVESVDSLTNFQATYNDTHLSLIGETASTLLDCPTVKIIVSVPDHFSLNRWVLAVQTGQIHIESFYGVESAMEIRLTTGAVHIDDLVVKAVDISTNAGTVIWKKSPGSVVSETAIIQTNSGYIGLSELYLSGSLSVGTKTGVITMNQVSSLTKISADGVWGVLHFSDCSSPTFYVNSDSAHVCLTNAWGNSVVEFATETGSLDTDALESAYDKECYSPDHCQILFASDETGVLHYYYIKTESGTVSLMTSN